MIAAVVSSQKSVTKERFTLFSVQYILPAKGLTLRGPIRPCIILFDNTVLD